VVALFIPKEELNGEWIGPVAVFDDDARENGWTGYLERDSWKTEADARAWAAREGHEFRVQVTSTVGVMRSYPPPADEARWQELFDGASSDERAELALIRDRLRRGREQIEAWQREHPPSWWHRLLLKFGPR
jgi:hypothetical protein